MTVEEILTAARGLSPAEFLRLRQRLDRLEKKLWEKELAQTTEELTEANLTDEKIDQIVLRRRRDSGL